MVANSSDMQFSGLLKCIIKEGLLTEADAQAHSDAAKKKQNSTY